MANLALGKKPIEAWKNPEQATNGKVTGYTGNHGFTYAEWPRSYTLDFEEDIPIRIIRFLLWDSLGVGKKRSDRKYQYILKASLDSTEWVELYTTDEIGSNGWQSFEFSNPLFARFIKLEAISNTANRSFHIVEFEVHDDIPYKLDADIMNEKTIEIDNEIEDYDEDTFYFSESNKVWDFLKKLGIIVGIIASIVTIVLLGSVASVKK